VSQPGERRFVGGCAGFVWLYPYHGQPGSHLDDRARREARITGSEEALKAIAV
jgi:hypothetical protein